MEDTKKPLRRRRCLFCAQLFQPKRKWQRFDKEECRREFHKFGAPYGEMKSSLVQIVDRKCAALTVEQSRIEVQMDAIRGQIKKIEEWLNSLA